MLCLNLSPIVTYTSARLLALITHHSERGRERERENERGKERGRERKRERELKAPRLKQWVCAGNSEWVCWPQAIEQGSHPPTPQPHLQHRHYSTSTQPYLFLYHKYYQFTTTAPLTQVSWLCIVTNHLRMAVRLLSWLFEQLYLRAIVSAVVNTSQVFPY